jgi:hypothetical protein
MKISIVKQFFKWLSVILFLFLANLTYAASFVCPNTFQTILTGDSMEQVTAACGPPTSTSTTDGRATTPVYQTKWVYSPTNLIQFTSNELLSEEIAIIFENDKVVAISSTESHALSKLQCLRHITLGSSNSDVIQQCGAPNYINHTVTGKTQSTTLNHWFYNYGRYKPQMIFTFQDGVLKDIKMGQLGR